MPRSGARRKLVAFVAALWLLAGTGLLLAPAAPPAEAANGGSPWTACAKEVRRAETATGMPALLLSAVAQVESGRWHAAARAKIAWPWTIGAEGRARYFATKAHAVAALKKLQAQGVRNIDVGCMQINLRAHPRAFASPEQALEPASNVAYAVRLLTELRGKRRSWQSAIGLYHSARPALHRPYLRKVLSAWHAQKGRGPESLLRLAEAGGPEALVPAPGAAGRHVPPFPPIYGIAGYAIDLGMPLPEIAQLALRGDRRALPADAAARLRETQLAAVPFARTGIIGAAF